MIISVYLMEIGLPILDFVAGRHVGLIHIIENAQLARVLVVQGEVVVVGAGLDDRAR